MIIIGERLNSSRRAVLEALRDKNAEYVLREARAQEKAGADYIDVNAAAVLGKEVETLTWVIPLLQRELKVPLAIDTPNLDAMEAGLRLHKGPALLNSLTGESARVQRFRPLIREHKPRVIVLCLDDEGVPTTSDREVAIACRMVDLLAKEGVASDDIFIDPLVRPIGVDHCAVSLFLESLDKIKRNLPQIKTVAGISNVSFGLPQRRLLNRALLVLALGRGLDAAIVDPLDKDILAARAAAHALLGHDPSFRDFLSFARKLKLQA
jgi:5-methyltetrahydrofolate--homocysteine methyltransferase